MKRLLFLFGLSVAAIGFATIQTGCSCCPCKGSGSLLQRPKMLTALPPSCPTPDGMAIDADGNLVVACPNFMDQTKPACLVKIDKKSGAVIPWANVPPLAETGVACPMGIDFGPDGDLYVCDNQGWKGTPQGQFRGRILRLRIRNNQAVATVVAEGMEHPNGVRVHNGFLYVTQSLMSKVKHPSGLMVSAVYRFRTDDTHVNVGNTLSDPNILATFVTENRFCQYGLDGVVFDRKGNLFVGNFGDGRLYKITFDANGKMLGSTLFAQTDFDTRLDPKKPGFLERATRARMRTTDGLCVDAHDNLYVADFSNNAIARVTPEGVVSVLWQNSDTDGHDGGLNEPGEPIIWKGKLVVTNFDAVFGPDNPDKVNTKNDQPATLSVLTLP